MKKRFFVALVEDITNGEICVINSKENNIFFENWKHYQNRKFYDVIFKTIVVDEEDLEATTNYLESACELKDAVEIRERAKRAWFTFDFNFKHCTIEEKEQMILSYDAE